MKANDEKYLKALIKSMNPDAPSAGFSDRVMNRIFEEQAALERVKQEPLLGKGFWIFLGLFAGLFALVFLLPGNGSGEAFDLLGRVNFRPVSSEYQSLYDQLGSVPLSIAGILLASSLLLFLDKLLNAREGLFTPK